MKKVYFEIENDFVIKHTPMPEIGENKCRTEVVMNKEIFLECYKKWVETQKEDKDTISRKAAIEAIRKDPMGGLNYEGILTRLPSVTPKQELCEDVISRQVAIDAFSMFAEYESNRTNAEWVDRIRVVLSSLPPVTPKQRIGHWIIISPTDMYCSECNEIEHLDTRRRFCAFCGAEMVEPRESEEV